jgi:hypothetical protein
MNTLAIRGKVAIYKVGAYFPFQNFVAPAACVFENEKSKNYLRGVSFRLRVRLYLCRFACAS